MNRTEQAEHAERWKALHVPQLTEFLRRSTPDEIRDDIAGLSIAPPGETPDQRRDRGYRLGYTSGYLSGLLEAQRITSNPRRSNR